ncbi:unnamed protein product [Musa acuminata subsp. malaccensis]|uniref:(wild Malaysian banana) hypothetical protein n=1 Tax=Musa acuminata subsp. malaccensis TaxID=214687 RepID=A0A804HWV0_MUSAM|nr:PREDICTED: uncharacterized protein LOC104000206 [Musa acuminata subsp. malaccensis]CAG1860447.1 unnamed protein product [Musa acuminata subsp. malaccensis]
MRHTVRPHRFTLCSPSLCCGCCYCVLFFALGIRYHQELLREVMQAASSAVFSSAPSSPAFLRLRSHKGNSIVATAVGNPTTESMAAKWAQKTVVIPPQRRGCHLITSKILKEIEQDLSGYKCGLAHLFLQHTSASLTINENYDSDVQDDTETFLSRIVPEGRSAPWKHTLEGPDDMPAHIKSSMFGCSLTIPITDGRLNMGTWQGIWLCEHRDHATARKVVITLNGM